MSAIEYSVLRYSPSLISGESINLGILFYDKDADRTEFYKTNNFKRVHSFDDELNIRALSAVMSSIEDDINTNVRLPGEKFEITYYTRYFSNEFKFTNPIMFETDDTTKAIDQLEKTYLRYDFGKSDRLKPGDERKILAQILKGQHVKYLKNGKLSGEFNEDIIYDYLVMNYGIKFYDLKKKQLKNFLTPAKAWAWNCEHAPTDIKTVIIYDIDDANDKTFDTILRIWKKAADMVYQFHEGIQFITSMSPDDDVSVGPSEQLTLTNTGS